MRRCACLLGITDSSVRTYAVLRTDESLTTRLYVRCRGYSISSRGGCQRPPMARHGIHQGQAPKAGSIYRAQRLQFAGYGSHIVLLTRRHESPPPRRNEGWGSRQDKRELGEWRASRSGACRATLGLARIACDPPPSGSPITPPPATSPASAPPRAALDWTVHGWSSRRYP